MTAPTAPSAPADEPPINYGSYLAVDELLSLQRPRSLTEAGTPHPDELLFIVVHQASELWFKVILHELAGLADSMAADDAGAALWRANRVNSLVRIVSAQLSALDTLPPQRFLQFRGYLGSSSGGQSAQFRAIEAASGIRDEHFIGHLNAHGPVAPVIQDALARPTLEELFLDMLARAGTTFETLYTGPGPSTLFFLAEALLEYDQQFARWRFVHVQLVERIIGPMTGGTGGSLGARYLAQTVTQRFFPVLWEARSRLYQGG